VSQNIRMKIYRSMILPVVLYGYEIWSLHLRNEQEPWSLSPYSAGLRAGRSGSRVRFPAGAGNLSLHHRVQNGSGAHPASYPMVTRDSFRGGKEAGAWSWPITSIQCRGQEWVELYLHSPNTPSWRGTQL
jgi:hypothetical protein